MKTYVFLAITLCIASLTYARPNAHTNVVFGNGFGGATFSDFEYSVPVEGSELGLDLATAMTRYIQSSWRVGQPSRLMPIRYPIHLQIVVFDLNITHIQMLIHRMTHHR